MVQTRHFTSKVNDGTTLERHGTTEESVRHADVADAALSGPSDIDVAQEMTDLSRDRLERLLDPRKLTDLQT